jgi:hypothetical protein
MHASHLRDDHYLYNSPELSRNANTAVGCITPEPWLQQRDQQQTDQQNQLPQMINSSLDPFIAIAVPITARQRRLVQFCL